MQAVQGTLDELGTPLREVTFVVVDLETTGSSPSGAHITEIGAVKVRGGQVLGEFQTLVRPEGPIPDFIQVLTGISNEMVAQAPRIGEVLPQFLEFAVGTVLVAHNAPFDVGFLRAAARDLELPWPNPAVVDTVKLARRLVSRDETPNHKLGTLAAYFGAETSPDHRALHDARATVDVLHALLDRAGGAGATTVEELAVLTSRVTPTQRRKRHLADGLPATPGVYMFTGNNGRVLYVGTSSDIRRRVRSYFTASEQRSRIRDMLAAATGVTPIICATDLEARVRELRLIAEHDPPYNRRSRRPENRPWVKLTHERFPRLSIVHRVRDDGATYCGPYPHRDAADAAIQAIHEILPLRSCTTRLARRSAEVAACLLADLGRCGAPCEGRQSVEDYGQIAARAIALMQGASRQILHSLAERMSELSSAERFEEAGAVRDRTATLIRGLCRSQRLTPLAATAQIVGARRRAAGGWEVVCVRYGRFAGTTLTPRGADPMPYIGAMIRTAEVVAAPTAPHPAAHPEETELLHTWLTTEGTRLVEVEGVWVCPVGGAEALADLAVPRTSPATSAWID
ncbi:DEDD exonuclease domain-containing protein [Gephyromycinifex aptenodytis]|uniref:DEDD exonuclease domain-containing protein n=1 Tax=Gephyromycinifex aptenodytis TaxID=2716227 RepID=UPI001447B2BB|nr:DEDD exonuclease domain-containing protein [Gephyromycinifex aptenodytis]